MTFQDLGLEPDILRALRAAGYETPTKIQKAAIGPALAGRDILGSAQTGTGKTAAFTLPLLQHLDAAAAEEPALRALVLTPTRELAAQIGESFSTYGAHLDLYHTVIFGGVSDKPQIDELRRGVDALIATPGRLLDLAGRGLVDLSHVDFFVLDEADRMLDMGFLPDVKRVIRLLPKKRQTLFLSATMPPAIRSLAGELLHDPVSLSVVPESTTADRIDQQLYFVDKHDKPGLLLELLGSHAPKRALVFTRTKHGANRLVKKLDRSGVRAAAIHGNKSQGARTRALEAFKKGELTLLVATDIAARGIDVDEVTHVVNYDLPNVPETYVHRIGRTARAGAEGIALSFCDAEERPYLVDIELLVGSHLTRVLDHGFPPSESLPAMTDLSSGRRRAQGSSGSKRGGAGGGRPKGKARRGRSSKSNDGRRPSRGAGGQANGQRASR